MASTGIKGLDAIITGLRVGDNVVWQIDDINEYCDFVEPFAEQAIKEGKKVVYMRFAEHKPLFKASDKVKIYEMDAKEGFEYFATEVNRIITLEGEGTYYVFDCLSDLLPAWSTDAMVGNFFMVTCPYLFELDTIAYFSILRDNLSFKTIARIRETTQLLLDVYKLEENYYIHPLKVWNRYTPTMFLPHIKENEEFKPITDSINTAQILSYIRNRSVETAKLNLDYWDRLFLKAEELLAESPKNEKKEAMIKHLCNTMLTHHERVMFLGMDNFSLEDLLKVKSRLIGTGFIGGKAVGMLLARKILLKEKSLDWKKLSEPHDSFYIGSDVFYTYIVQNGWWKLKMSQKTDQGYYESAKILKEKMLYGRFPEETMEQFQQIIEYFGTSPLIVRSSSLLEDGFGNAFAGKYESVFCPNQGTPEQRYLQFVEAVKKVYSSTMSEDALTYRKQRGLDKMEEQMALLVQRVSGSYHGDYFFPDIAGVGVSYNTYVWNKEMEPKAGMTRLVYGLGTRAVDRVEGDYPRIAALDAPLLQAHAGMEDTVKFSQHNVDLINVKENNFSTVPFNTLIETNPDLKIDLVAVKDHQTQSDMRARGIRIKDRWVITFDKFFNSTDFIDALKKVLKTLEDNYAYPVDIEFTVNFTEGDNFKINLLQCRPLQTRGLGEKVDIPGDIAEKKVLFSSDGFFLGGNISQTVKRIIYVDPELYATLEIPKKYNVARIIGKLNRKAGNKEDISMMLLGPGRWGTTTPSLGVPVTFSEINNVSVLGEIAFTGGNLMPELSFGTHFFQDLVETGIFYVAIFPEKKNVIFNDNWMLSFENKFSEILPDNVEYENIIRVYDIPGSSLKIMSDVLTQKIVCFTK